MLDLIDNRSLGLLRPIRFRKEGDFSIELPSDSASVTVGRELFISSVDFSGDFFCKLLFLLNGFPLRFRLSFSFAVTGASACKGFGAADFEEGILRLECRVRGDVVEEDIALDDDDADGGGGACRFVLGGAEGDSLFCAADDAVGDMKDGRLFSPETGVELLFASVAV